MKIKRDIAISDTGFVFDPTTGDSYTLNVIAKELVLLMKENKPYEFVEQHVLDRYDIDKITFERNFEDFKQMLLRYNLLEAE